MNTAQKNHWNNIYATKPVDGVSWYQQKPEKSLQIIHQFTPSINHPNVIDVGGGTSTLVDYLLADGYDSLVILDIAESALAQTKQRLGDVAQKVSWLVADITNIDLPSNTYDLWHDRAVFHFLIMPEDQVKYVCLVEKTLKSGGILVMSTFAPDGPEKCSNLNVNRYDCDNLWEILGQNFKLIYSDTELHQTPFHSQQAFSYCVFQKL
jgi:ubiquinone/menaquinone biosynthesis C-methylase UbiE